MMKSELLKTLKDLELNLAPISIMSDFEVAFTQASRATFPGAEHNGCFFHFSQCIFRAIQVAGLQARFEADVKFALTMRMLPALAFVPGQNVVSAFETLCESDELPLEAEPVVQYFEENWIGKVNLRRQRSQPRFQLIWWNAFDATKANLPRTNNNVEAWHRVSEALVGAHHENLSEY